MQMMAECISLPLQTMQTNLSSTQFQIFLLHTDIILMFLTYVQDGKEIAIPCLTYHVDLYLRYYVLFTLYQSTQTVPASSTW